ncbi:hypothetical protein fugu_010892 [Takifugu bimaculatus]|uniref:Cyclin N-terminal domain-containing protein n=1 Tax=Takifugu bimaculatus TaxID=433685 RepID=A0A4Z2CBH2_9TELE|nr:hypothetical protein fugu_010892 [Takifugu bimaculatus]
MARTGFCDSKPLLDLHKKVDDRVPVRSWGNGCAPIDGWQSLGPDERLVVNVEVDVERKWDMMQFQAETLYLAVHLLNRCLRQMKVSGLCYLMDHTYTKHQLLRMERKVLCGLKFDLSHCPPLHFLILFASIAHCSTKMVWMARYLLELSLMDGQCVAFLPVHLAGAALCLARQVLQEPPTPEGEAAWCLVSSLHIGSESVLLRIMSILASAAATAQTRDTCATYLKYSSADTMHEREEDADTAKKN